jgi:hypothetical protein
MKDSVYLTFNRKGIGRLKKGSSAPTLKPGYYAVRIDLEVPEKFFDKFLPIAEIKLSEENILLPEIKTEQAERNLFNIIFGET